MFTSCTLYFRVSFIVQPSQPRLAVNVSCHASAICCEEKTALSTLNSLMGGITMKLPVSWDQQCLPGITFSYSYSAAATYMTCSLPEQMAPVLPCEKCMWLRACKFWFFHAAASTKLTSRIHLHLHQEVQQTHSAPPPTDSGQIQTLSPPLSGNVFVIWMAYIEFVLPPHIALSPLS